MWQQNEFSKRLGLRYPIVQGPFGGGLSSVELLGLVSDLGGLGSYGVHHLAASQISDLAKTLHARTAKPFALNLWVNNQDPGGDALSSEQFSAGVARFKPYYDELGLPAPTMPDRYGENFLDQVQAVIDAKPAVLSFVFGIPPADVLAECRRRDITTIGTITTIDEAVQMEAADVDAIVATGFEAGGHRVSFLQSAENSLTGTMALIPTVVDRVKIPVIAAGGIGDGRGIAAALMLGAHGVQIGTAFLACAQSGTSDVHRVALRSERARYTMLTRAFSGRLARGIRNRFAEEFAAFDEAIFPYPIQGWFAGGMRAAAVAQNRPDLMSLWSGQAAPLLRQTDAAELFSSLVAQTDFQLRRFAQR
jgi:nitronate monooxygenase